MKRLFRKQFCSTVTVQIIMTTLTTLATLSLSIYCINAAKLENVGYLGAGYDIVFGNPHTSLNLFDPGFRQKIYDLTNYSEWCRCINMLY